METTVLCISHKCENMRMGGCRLKQAEINDGKCVFFKAKTESSYPDGFKGNYLSELKEQP